MSILPHWKQQTVWNWLIFSTLNIVPWQFKTKYLFFFNQPETNKKKIKLFQSRIYSIFFLRAVNRSDILMYVLLNYYRNFRTQYPLRDSILSITHESLRYYWFARNNHASREKKYYARKFLLFAEANNKGAKNLRLTFFTPALMKTNKESLGQSNSTSLASLFIAFKKWIVTRIAHFTQIT